MSKDMDDIWVCDYCGSEEVEEKVWVNINTQKIIDTTSIDDYYCDGCQDETKPMTYFDWQEKIAEEYNLFVLEDAAHALESGFNSFKIASVNHAVAFSFYANKNITTAGEGGAIATNDNKLAEKETS